MKKTFDDFVFDVVLPLLLLGMILYSMYSFLNVYSIRCGNPNQELYHYAKQP